MQNMYFLINKNSFEYPEQLILSNKQSAVDILSNIDTF